MRPPIRAVLLTLVSSAIVTSAAGAQAAKFAYVHTDVLMQQAPGAALADTLYNKDMAVWQGQLKAKQDSIVKMEEAFDKLPKTTSDSVKAVRANAIQTAQTDLQGLQLQLQQKAQQRHDQLIAPIQDLVQHVLDDIRAEDGYAMIFIDEPTARSIATADKNLDITDRVLSRLKTLPAPKLGGTPASATPAGPAALKRPPGR